MKTNTLEFVASLPCREKYAMFFNQLAAKKDLVATHLPLKPESFPEPCRWIWEFEMKNEVDLVNPHT